MASLFSLQFLSLPEFSLKGNYIDLVILAIVLIYVLDAVEKGFFSVLSELVSFLASLIVALRGYHFAGELLVSNFSLPPFLAKALGFVLVAWVAQTALGILINAIFQKFALTFYQKWWNKAAAIAPAILDSLILISIFLTLFVSLPLPTKIKADASSSKIGGFLLSRAAGLESALSKVFGEATAETINFLTIKPGSGERVKITQQPRTLSVDATSEARMLELANAERAKVGAGPLSVDSTIVAVARSHSRDMWERSYFSHINPNNEDPFDRMRRGGVSFTTAGENLALAPTAELSHQGLMNSEGHRRNILDPNFGRVGIGIIDGGIYGKMFTQNFAD